VAVARDYLIVHQFHSILIDVILNLLHIITTLESQHHKPPLVLRSVVQ